MQLEATLKSVFGYNEFRFQQKEIIERTLKGADSLVIMPTGGGKSLCYQLPAILNTGITVVLSPLIALMKDQVSELEQLGVSAAFLNSSLDQGQQNKVVSDLKEGKNKILFISPERLFANDAYFLNFLKKFTVSLFALDEAHCISQWGHDFRAEYLKVSLLRREFPSVPIMALTATADDRTRNSILKILNLKQSKTYISSFDRKNIKYRLKPKQNTKKELLKIVDHYKNESGIIYTLSRKSADNFADFLKDQKYSAAAYHAGMDAISRAKVQEDFIFDRTKIVVATIAFGMGINKSNVRYVVHTDMPKNIESYYQETGRAGRDGLPSEAILFFSRGDAMMLKRFILTDDDDFNDVILGKLNQMLLYCEAFTCRREYLLNYFGEEYKSPCGNCDNCLSDQELIDGNIISKKVISAVIRLKTSFGITYVIDFLRGSNSIKIREWHKSLPTFGVGKDMSKHEWLSYIHQLVGQKILKVKDGKYPVLELGEQANAVLQNSKDVQLVKVQAKKEKSKTKPIGDYDQTLFEKIRSMRSKLAKEAGVPAYVIFSDKTIIDICEKLPKNNMELDNVHGFGKVKIQKYGEAVLELLNEN